MPDDAIDYVEHGLTVVGSTVIDEAIRPKVEETIADMMSAGREIIMQI